MALGDGFTVLFRKAEAYISANTMTIQLIVHGVLI